MSLLLILGIAFVAIPAITILALALVMFGAFVRDDDDSSALFTFALGLMGAGVFLIIIHYVLEAAA
jgi:hypothetical protein